MNRCLSEKELLMLNAAGRSGDARTHLEACLSCARNYRNLENDLGELVTALKRPAPAVPLMAPRTANWSPGLRWALAASVIVAAFVCGRFTGLTMPHSVTVAQSTTAKASSSASGANNIVMADNTRDAPPASYGLYIDDLIGADQGQAAAGTQDSDDRIDRDSGAF